MAIKRYNKEVNKNKFAFGIMALSQFNINTGTSDTIQSVAAAFQGSTKLKSIIEMVKAGYAQANDKMLTNPEVSELVEAMTPEQRSELIDCFLSSLVGEDFNEWAAKVEAELAELEAAEQAEADASTEAEASQATDVPNDDAPSTAGAKTKKQRSES